MSDEAIVLYVILGIGYLILSICMIVKFFEMAKNIKVLKEISSENDSINFLIANGYIIEAKRKLCRKVWNDWDKATSSIYNENEEVRNSIYNRLKEKYNDLFISIGEVFPTYDNLRKK